MTKQLTTAQRLTKYWTNTYTEEQYKLCMKQAVKKVEKEGSAYLILYFNDSSSVEFWCWGGWYTDNQSWLSVSSPETR
jgi:hypothetical protein